MTEIGVGTQVTPTIRLVRRLGSGGMGSVWVAEHSALRTEVVVKFLAERLLEDPTSQARFAREAAAAAQVKSPHVVQMLDHGISPDGYPFIVMELLEGHDLARELRRRVLAPEEVAHVVEHVALALHRAHAVGIVHRDIKPNNIFLCDVGASTPFVKLLDFGIAREGDQHLTTTGNLVGTPAYMSPEQLSGRDVDARSDLWSLGMVAFKALTGKNPFEKPTIPETVGAVVFGELPVPSTAAPDLPSGIDAWFARACAREPASRFANALELSQSLWLALGVSKTIASSPAANPQPLWPSPDPTVPITPSHPITEGTLRSTVDSRAGSPSLSTELRPPADWRRRALVVAVATALVSGVAIAAFNFGTLSNAPNVRLQAGLSSVASLAARAKIEVPPPPTPARSAAPEGEQPKPRHPPHSGTGARPQPRTDDDELGF